MATQGFTWVDGELDSSTYGMAVPVRDQVGAVFAAISLNTMLSTIGEENAKTRFLRPLERDVLEIGAQTARSHLAGTSYNLRLRALHSPHHQQPKGGDPVSHRLSPRSPACPIWILASVEVRAA